MNFCFDALYKNEWVKLIVGFMKNMYNFCGKIPIIFDIFLWVKYVTMLIISFQI